MPFKKLHVNIKEKLESLEIVTPTPFQTKSIPVIKSGANTYCIAPKDSGKTTALILTTLNNLKCQAMGNSPRAIILVENKESVLKLYEQFLFYTKHNSLRVYASYEELHIDVQKSEIFMGVDILISTPKTMNRLFLLNGVNVAAVKTISIDDAEFLSQKTAYNAMMSITQSINKCQFVIYIEKIHPMLKRFETRFMEYSKTIKF